MAALSVDGWQLNEDAVVMQSQRLVPSVPPDTVSLLVTFMSPAKTAEPIEVPFGGLTWVGPRNHVLDGGPIPKGEELIFCV